MNNTIKKISITKGANPIVGKNPDNIINTAVNVLKNPNSRKKYQNIGKQKLQKEL